MLDLIVYAIPAFALLLAVEAVSFRIAAREDLKGYELRDTGTSLSMGVGNVLINIGWKAVVVPPHQPRGARLLGEPRGAPLLAVLQPLDGAAADVDADDLLPVLGAARPPRLQAMDDLHDEAASLTV